MSRERAENDSIRALWMAAEDRRPLFPKQNGPSPLVREGNIFERWMKLPDAPFERLKHFRRLARCDVDFPHVIRFAGAGEARAPHNGVVAAKAPPQIRKVDGVKRLTLPQPDGFNLFGSERRAECSERQFWKSAFVEPRQLEGCAIVRKKNFSARMRPPAKCSSADPLHAT